MKDRSFRRPSPAQLETLRRLGAATVHEAQGQTGALPAAIKPIDPSRRLAGPALTVDARPGDNLIVHFALTKARPGDVLVINAHGYLECGLWGDILTLAAQQVGVLGLVVDGAVRDIEAIIALGFPVFARGVSIKGPQKSESGRINVPTECGGVEIRPGDVVLGDRDGVVVVPNSKLEEVIAAAQQREVAELALRRGIQDGRSTVELLQLANKLTQHGMG